MTLTHNTVRWGETQQPKHVVLCLHGYGDTYKNFSQHARQLSRQVPMGQTMFVALQGLEPNGFGGDQWFPLQTNLYRHLEKSIVMVHSCIELLGIEYPQSVIHVLGFSQGACLALASALTSTKKIGWVFALSGWVLQSYAYESNPNILGILWLHGQKDTVVFPAMFYDGIQVLKHKFANHSMVIEGRMYKNLAHEITEQTWQDVSNTIAKIRHLD
jgi:predicted esterase